MKELHVLFQNLERRRAIVNYLRHNVQLRTNHLRPFLRNTVVRCNDIFAESAHLAPAYRGYLCITVGIFFAFSLFITHTHTHLGAPILSRETWNAFAPSAFALCCGIRRGPAPIILSAGSAERDQTIQSDSLIFFFSQKC